MTNWALQSGINYLEDAGSNLAGSAPTTITAAGSAHTKGGWTQLIAATVMPGCALEVTYRPNTATNRGSIDIGIGAGGSETVKIPDLMCDHNNVPSVLVIPLNIPAGTRIAARAQSETASTTYLVSVQVIPASELSALGYEQITNIGFNAATTRAILLDAGAVINTMSAWVDLTTNLPHDVRWLAQLVLGGGVSGASSNLIIELGLWDGAAYQHLRYLHIKTVTAGKPIPQCIPGAWVDLKAGARLGARIQSSGADAGSRTLDIALLGVG